MNEFYNSFFEGPAVEGSSPAPIPAENSTTPNSLSTQYIYTIVAIYAIVLILVFAIIVVIVIQSIQKSLCSSSCRKTGYVTVSHDDRQSSHHSPGELSPVLEITATNARDNLSDHDADSEYDNVSLDLERIENELMNADDIPPDYENPPEYSSPVV